MNCPAKLCKQEIPDDSLYCDQCGIQILRCTKCGDPGTSKFCGKCGGPMAFREVPEPAAGTDSAAPEPAATIRAVSSKTKLIQRETKKLLFCHPDGWNIEVVNGDILGRTSGNHTDRLGSISVISGAHAKITFENNAWYIIDQKSTNKTYVGGIRAQPGIPERIKNNDVVQLADVRFIVREV